MAGAGRQALYSERFLQMSTPLVLEAFTVPAGKRAVVRTITIFNGTTAEARAEVSLAGHAVIGEQVPARSSRSYTGLACVVYAGEHVAGYLYNQPVHLTVSGYLFDDTSSSDKMAPADPGLPIVAPEDLEY